MNFRLFEPFREPPNHTEEFNNSHYRSIQPCFRLHTPGSTFASNPSAGKRNPTSRSTNPKPVTESERNRVRKEYDKLPKKEDTPGDEEQDYELVAWLVIKDGETD